MPLVMEGWGQIPLTIQANFGSVSAPASWDWGNRQTAGPCTCAHDCTPALVILGWRGLLFVDLPTAHLGRLHPDLLRPHALASTDMERGHLVALTVVVVERHEHTGALWRVARSTAAGSTAATKDANGE